VKYLGVDWATKEHVVALVDEDGQHVDTWTVRHTWSDVLKLIARLQREGGPEGIRIAMEPGAARLRDALRTSGYVVYEINPKRSDRFRDRFSPAGAKDDRRDALVLAHAVRTDERWMRAADDPSELDEELRQRCRARAGLIDHRRRLQQQLHQVLSESYDAILAIGLRLTSPFVLALLRAYPHAAAARRCRRPRLERLIREHRIRRVDAAALAAILRAESFPVPQSLALAYADQVRWLVDAIEQASRSIEEADRAIERLFVEHPDRDILLSVPGLGAVQAPLLVAEVTTSLGPAPDARSLQTLAGTCPVTKRSGKQKRGWVGMRHACKKDLQGAMYTVARCSVRSSAWARAYYDQQRARGAGHNAALRALSNKWLKILAALLRDRSTYDEERHQQALRRAGVPWAPKPAEEAGKAA
jgi:transposase